jgi:hypothetical protein
MHTGFPHRLSTEPLTSSECAAKVLSRKSLRLNVLRGQRSATAVQVVENEYFMDNQEKILKHSPNSGGIGAFGGQQQVPSFRRRVRSELRSE